MCLVECRKRARLKGFRTRTGVELLALLLLTACDESFVAFEDNDLVFSMYGYLDAARDTQWLRVTPIRTSIETEPGPVDAVVTIEEVETGRMIVMTDSLFHYHPLNPSGTSVFAHNFSTREPIRAGFSYRIHAVRSDGASSSVSVSIPDVEPWLVLRKPSSATIGVDRVRVFGVRNVAVLQTVWTPSPRCEYTLTEYTQIQQHLVDQFSDDGFHEFDLSSPLQRTPLEAPPPCLPLAEREQPLRSPFQPLSEVLAEFMGPASLQVIASGEPWLHDPTRNRSGALNPFPENTVSNGIGFIGGVFTSTFPYEPERCTLTVPGPFCDIVFDGESATLEGSVIESCDGEPLADMAVALREVSGTRIRPAVTDSTGTFRIRGLEPETNYRLTVTRSRFLPHESDLVFDVAEIRTLPTIALEWEFAFDPCQFR